MNVLTYIEPDVSFPWFDEVSEPGENKSPCKIYNDGGHYIASLISSVKNKKIERPKRLKMRVDELFDELYLKGVKQNLKKDDLVSYIKAGLESGFPAYLSLDAFVSDSLSRKHLNLRSRIKRFRRKAALNRWNYFVTITYDDKKHNSKTFKEKLKKCLSNFHSRRAWKYMGVFEEAPETGRLHFHAIMYIPEGQIPGAMENRTDYNKKKRKVQKVIVNTFFEKQFGRNDFRVLNDAELRCGNTMSYLLKYLEKTGERIVYSRGIPTEIEKDIDLENDVVCEMLDFVVKYILFDDVIDYKRDILKCVRQDSA